MSYMKGQVLQANLYDDVPDPSSTTRTLAQIGQNSSIFTTKMAVPSSLVMIFTSLGESSWRLILKQEIKTNMDSKFTNNL